MPTDKSSREGMSPAPPPIGPRRDSRPRWILPTVVAFVVLLLILLLLIKKPKSSEEVARNDSGESSASSSNPGSPNGANPGAQASGESQVGTASSSSSSGAGEPDEGASSVDGPEAALREANRHYQASQSQAANGNTGDATQSAIKAWELANQFPGDPACAELANRLLPEIKTLAARSNQRFQDELRDDSKPLVEK